MRTSISCENTALLIMHNSDEGKQHRTSSSSFTSVAATVVSASHTPSSKVSVFAVALLCFSCVAGGPFGIEAAVQAAGALPTILGLALAGVLWGCPQALLTAELAAAIPANGGPVVWTRRAFGDKVAFVNGILLVFNQVIDICLYPTLVATYCQELFPEISDAGAYGIKMGALAITVALNIIGVEALSASAALLTGIILAPFVLLPMIAAGNHMDFQWSAIGTAGIPSNARSNLALFASTILWNMQGWSEIGCLAGEIQEAEKVFPRGMGLAALLVVVSYSCPVLFGVALVPNLDLWQDGFLVTLAKQVAPWLSGFVLLSAALANMSTFLTSMAAYSRTMQAVANEHIIPIPILSRNFTKYKTPVPTIIALAISTAALGSFDFSDLVVLDSTFYMVANMIIIASFLRLKYTEPDLPRPYLFPGGIHGAWIAFISTQCLALFAIWAVCDGSIWEAGTVFGVLVFLIFASYLWEKYYKRFKYASVNPDDEELELEINGQPTTSMNTTKTNTTNDYQNLHVVTLPSPVRDPVDRYNLRNDGENTVISTTSTDNETDDPSPGNLDTNFHNKAHTTVPVKLFDTQ